MATSIATPRVETRSRIGLRIPASWPRMAWWQAVLALIWCGVLSNFAFVRATSVPFLNYADLLIHEAGHAVFIWAPMVVYFAMGSGTQILVPLLVAARKLWRWRSPFGGAIALAWAAESMQNASQYIADAPYQNLPLLIPGMKHDWAFLLGPEHCNCLSRAGLIANIVDGIAVATMCVAVFLCVLAVMPRARTTSSSAHPEAIPAFPGFAGLTPVAAPGTASSPLPAATGSMPWLAPDPPVPDWRPDPGLGYAPPAEQPWIPASPPRG